MTKFVPIEGYSDYLISDDGQVKSLKFGKDRILKLRKHRQGYREIELMMNGVSKSFRIHRLVCEAFHMNPQNKLYVNHKNGIKNDNRKENLEWCTSSENNKHAYNSKLNIGQTGSANGRSKITIAEVKRIRKLLSEGVVQRVIASELDVPQHIISDISTGRSWKETN